MSRFIQLLYCQFKIISRSNYLRSIWRHLYYRSPIVHILCAKPNYSGFRSDKISIWSIKAFEAFVRMSTCYRALEEQSHKNCCTNYTARTYFYPVYCCMNINKRRIYDVPHLKQFVKSTQHALFHNSTGNQTLMLHLNIVFTVNISGL